MTIKDRITKARTSLILDHPFFGVLSMNLTPKEDEAITPTAATDGKMLYYNPKWIEALNDPQLLGVIAHEIMHCALSHTTRRDTRDPLGWNIACDFAINLLLKAQCFVLPEGGLLDPQFKDMPAEEIYSKLPPPPPKPKGGNGGDGEGKEGFGGMKPGESCGDVLDATKPHDKEGKGKIEGQWKEWTGQAAQYAKRIGKLPAGMEKLIDGIINPPAPWREILAQFVSQIAKNDFSWMRPNRRFVSQGLYLPSLHSVEIPPIYVAIDTSGSIYGEPNVLAQFEEELTNIVSAYQTTLKIIYCDVTIGKEEEQTEATLKLPPIGRV